MRRFRRVTTFLLYCTCLCLVLLPAMPASGDWLVTLQGTLIETDGPWVVTGKTLTYTDLEGTEHTLAVDEVDLEGSEETTALKAGRPYVPQPKIPPPAVAPVAENTASTREAHDEPKITLYMTTWCGYCRKARKLLKELDADFAAKDIEKDRAAAREFRKKGKGRGGVPLIDFDGEIVRGYNDRLIRKRVREIQKENASG